eukprot:8621-Heterococcus_DN1.PRE.2
MDYQDLSDGAKQQLEAGISMSTPTSSRSNSTTTRAATAAAYSSNGNGVSRSASTSSLVQQKKSGPALLRKDAGSVLLLLLLYTLQGIPMGLSGSIPLLLHDKFFVFNTCFARPGVTMPTDLILAAGAVQFSEPAIQLEAAVGTPGRLHLLQTIWPQKILAGACADVMWLANAVRCTQYWYMDG